MFPTLIRHISFMLFLKPMALVNNEFLYVCNIRALCSKNTFSIELTVKNKLNVKLKIHLAYYQKYRDKYGGKLGISILVLHM